MLMKSVVLRQSVVVWLFSSLLYCMLNICPVFSNAALLLCSSSKALFALAGSTVIQTSRQNQSRLLLRCTSTGHTAVDWMKFHLQARCRFTFALFEHQYYVCSGPFLHLSHTSQVLWWWRGRPAKCSLLFSCVNRLRSISVVVQPVRPA